MAECTIRYMYQLVHKEEQMLSLPAGAPGMTRPALEAAWELAGDIRNYCERATRSASGYRGRVIRRTAAARAHAAARTLRFMPSAVHRI
jgi:hypothetical protein